VIRVDNQNNGIGEPQQINVPRCLIVTIGFPMNKRSWALRVTLVCPISLLLTGFDTINELTPESEAEMCLAGGEFTMGSNDHYPVERQARSDSS
jgi:hypothetical protein